MSVVFHKASSRGYAKHDWLTTHYSFSFASYYDSARMGFGALRVLNDDMIAPGMGFGKHPHDNMEIITIPLSGAIRHEDNMGNSAVMTAGEVQVMSGGTGVEHAEFNASDTEALTVLQVWISSKQKNVTPRYAQGTPDLSVKNMFVEVVGRENSNDLWIHQDASLSLGRFEAGAKITYTLKAPGKGVYFFVMDGEIVLEAHTLEKRDALGIWGIDKAVEGEAQQHTFLLAIEVPME